MNNSSAIIQSWPPQKKTPKSGNVHRSCFHMLELNCTPIHFGVLFNQLRHLGFWVFSSYQLLSVFIAHSPVANQSCCSAYVTLEMVGSIPTADYHTSQKWHIAPAPIPMTHIRTCSTKTTSSPLSKMLHARKYIFYKYEVQAITISLHSKWKIRPSRLIFANIQLRIWYFSKNCFKPNFKTTDLISINKRQQNNPDTRNRKIATSDHAWPWPRAHFRSWKVSSIFRQ